MAVYMFDLSGVGIGGTEEEAWEDVWQWMQEKAQKGYYDTAVLIGGQEVVVDGS